VYLSCGSARFSQTTTERKTVMSKRETIDTGTDVGRSLSADRRHKAKNEAKPGEGDRGDRPTKHCAHRFSSP
jgi:hypothetical protein